MSGFDTIMMNGYLADSGDSDIGYLYSDALDDVDKYNMSNSDTDSTDFKTEDMFSSVIVGGNTKTNDKSHYHSTVPKGGFPKIYVYKNKTKQKEENNKQRELSVKKSDVSIMDILNQKRLSRLSRTNPKKL